jgi:uncharacterized protein (TIGR00661 family)
LKLLIAPLDWGLGHTTRCIPIIQYLLQNKKKVVFAGNEFQKKYITTYFPQIDTLTLEGYNVHYSRSRAGFIWSLFRQLPKLYKTVQYEHSWLLKMAALYNFDGIISDNRYGLYHPNIPSVFITHQLQLHTGLGKFADQLACQLHERFISRFHTCWIPDVAGHDNLGGKLSHPEKLPQNTNYLGWLSALQTPELPANTHKHILILLSGPEPQRSILSDILWHACKDYTGNIIFVEGRQQVQSRADIPKNIHWKPYVTPKQLQPIMQEASLVICRSGYSTLMDLVTLQKKAVLIPTPGQTEQEYLGKALHQKGVFYSIDQSLFQLAKVLQDIQTFPFRLPVIKPSMKKEREEILDQWLASL